MKVLLVVDDERPTRTGYADALRQAGFEVLEAEDGRAAIKRSDSYKGNIDLAILDYSMPGFTGATLAEWLRGSRPEMLILMVSGWTPEIVDVPYTFLQKPVESAVLVSKVREMLHDETTIPDGIPPVR